MRLAAYHGIIKIYMYIMCIQGKVSKKEKHICEKAYISNIKYHYKRWNWNKPKTSVIILSFFNDDDDIEGLLTVQFLDWKDWSSGWNRMKNKKWSGIRQTLCWPMKRTETDSLPEKENETNQQQECFQDSPNRHSSGFPQDPSWSPLYLPILPSWLLADTSILLL